MSDLIVNEHGSFRPEELCGYAGPDRPDLLREAFDLWGDEFPELRIVGDAGPKPARVMLWELYRKISGGVDWQNIAQQVGDCFPANTLVTMGDGSLKPIQDVRPGDSVRTPQGNVQSVLDTFSKKYTGELHTIHSGGYQPPVRCTSDHQFIHLKNGSCDWSPASSLLSESDVLISDGVVGEVDGLRGETVRIESNVSESVVDLDVYCIEVEHDHAFIANGYAVHNCVSWGIRNALNATQCGPILNGAFYQFRDTFAPYFYGISRVQIGGTRLGLMDGSLGIWGSKGVMQYGALASDSTGVPAYSGSIARSWGRGSGPPTGFIEEGKKHLVKSSAKVSSWDSCVEAVKNLYGVSVASNYGFQMRAGSDGFHRAQGRWDHQMAIIGVDTGGDGIPSHGCVLNSWGDVHGELRDLRDPSIIWPKGTLRVRPEVIDAMLKQGDSFSYSMFDGFPAQKLGRQHFDLW